MADGELGKQDAFSPAPTSEEKPVRLPDLSREMAPQFSNLTDDIHLLENLIRFAKICEQHNVPIAHSVQTLTRAIGVSNGGNYSVLVHDYLNAIPDYPPTQNGEEKAFTTGQGQFGNIFCYKNRLYGVLMFPASEHVTFYFPEFSAYAVYVQGLIFSYGNKTLRFCPEKKALAFDFKPSNPLPREPNQPIILTATLKRKLDQEVQRQHDLLLQTESAEGKRRRAEKSVDFIQLD